MTMRAIPALVIVVLLSLSAGVFSQEKDKVWTPSSSESYFRALLFQAQHSEANYWKLTAEGGLEIDRRASLESAIEAWMIIWQCYGYDPAVDKIRELSALEPKPERHVGFSPDLTIEADATLMDLKNPRFADYSFFLVRITDRHFETLEVKNGAVAILDSGGRWHYPEPIVESHPLYQSLRKLASTYDSERNIGAGITFTFKQVFGARGLTSDKIRLIWVETGRGSVVIPFLETLTSSKDLGPLVERVKAAEGAG
ncbi:MAG: hypothetical protein HRF49_02445 [bacterium]|jgi:hypothetical protein